MLKKGDTVRICDRKDIRRQYRGRTGLVTDFITFKDGRLIQVKFEGHPCDVSFTALDLVKIEKVDDVEPTQP